MGIVYRARDEALGRPIALKVIAPIFAADHRFRERFRRESRLTAQIEHHNVVPVYRAGQDAGRLYIAMRFIEGTDLATRLRTQDRLPPPEAVSIITEVARALDAAHARGLVHRDVKPGNVLLAAGRVYLTDFGLSVEIGGDHGLTRTGHWVGTLAYVAPEQIRAGAVDARTDVYALGGVLHHCLTGQVPYPSAHELDALSAHLFDPPPIASAVVSGIPKKLDAVIARAMSKDPAGRFVSAGDLAAAAEAALSGHTPSLTERSVATGAAAPRVAPRLSGVRRPRRSGIVAAGAATIVAAGLAIAFTLPAARGPARPKQPVNRAGRVHEAPIVIGLPPDHMALIGGEVWALHDHTANMVRVNERTRAVSSVGSGFGGFDVADLAAGRGGLWVADRDARAGAINRLDPRDGSIVATTALRRARAITVGLGATWALAAPSTAAGQARLLAIDGRSGRRLGRAVELDGGAVDLVAGAGAVWVIVPRHDQVLRVDPRTRQVVARVPVGDRPAKIAASGNDVWVASTGDQVLTHIDAANNRPVGAPVRLGKQLDDIALGPGALWVAAGDSTVTRLDPGTGAVIGSAISTLKSPLTLAADADGVWVGSGPQQRIQEILART